MITKQDLLNPNIAPFGPGVKINELLRALRAKGDFYGPEVDYLNRLRAELAHEVQDRWHDHPSHCSICGNLIERLLYVVERRSDEEIIYCCNHACVPYGDIRHYKVHYL